jgi:hypothetical protein
MRGAHLLERVQWQLLQLVLVQPEQPDEPDAGVKVPLLLKPQADMRRLTSSLSHRGQVTCGSLPRTMVSNSSLQLAHLYS